MENLIDPGAPVVRSVTHNSPDDTIEARVECLVDGYAAEIRHEVNTKDQKYNRHRVVVFEPVGMTWNEILAWGRVEAGHIPVHPESETLAALTGLSEVMWSYANRFVIQSSRRQEELDVQQYVDEREASAEALWERQRAAMLGALDDLDDTIPETYIDRGTWVDDEKTDDEIAFIGEQAGENE